MLRRLHPGAVILAYHNVVRARHVPPLGDPGLHLPLEAFRAQVAWLAEHYRVVPLAELVERLHAGRPLRRLAAITFDDGYRGVLAHALPILRDLGLPATLFLVGHAPAEDEVYWWDHPAILRPLHEERRTSWLDELRGDQRAIVGTLDPAVPEHLPAEYRPASWSEIADAIGGGIDVGAHSDRHQALTRLTSEEIECDLAAVRYSLETHLEVRPQLLAYPYGLWDQRVREAARAAGYAAACTLDPEPLVHGTDPWSLPRLNIPAGIGTPAFECWLAGLHR